MESNPYAAPAAVVGDVGGSNADDLESRKAGRGKRLGAVLLDGLIYMVGAAPIMGAAVWYSVAAQEGMPRPQTAGMLMFLGVLLVLGVMVVNFVMVHQSGQTIGKRMLGIAIVRTDGSRMGLTRFIFIRGLPVGLLGAIPYVGWLVSLIDPLLIFGKERRCLHDLIADTIVVDV